MVRGKAKTPMLYTRLNDAGTAFEPERNLIQKAVGWTLREAGKIDPNRLERYLRLNGSRIPRTTLRYAIERFPRPKQQELLRATRTRNPEPGTRNPEPRTRNPHVHGR